MAKIKLKMYSKQEKKTRYRTIEMPLVTDNNGWIMMVATSKECEKWCQKNMPKGYTVRYVTILAANLNKEGFYGI